MKLSIIFLLCMITLVSSGNAFAQGDSPLVKQRKAEVQQLMKDLNLTREQQKAVQALDKKYAPQKSAIEKKTLGQIQAIAADKKLSKESVQSKVLQLLAQRRMLLKPIQVKQNQEMLKILNPGQQKTWQAFLQKRASR